MPYYSVRVAGGDKCDAIARELKETFRGKDADFTGHPFFYVNNHSRIDEFRSKVAGLADDDCEITIARISKSQYDRGKY